MCNMYHASGLRFEGIGEALIAISSTRNSLRKLVALSFVHVCFSGRSEIVGATRPMHEVLKI